MIKQYAANEKRQQGAVWMRMLFLIYLFAVIRLIVFKYPVEEFREIAAAWSRDVIRKGLDTANFTPFRTIRMYIVYAHKLNSFENLVGNILIFVPFGFGLPCVWMPGRRLDITLLNAFVFVLGIEVFQLMSAFGAFDVDDLLLNCLGAVWGYLFYLIMEIIHRRKRGKPEECSTDRQSATGAERFDA